MAIDDKNFNTDNNDDLEFNSNSENIEFDDNIDIDALQNQLQAHMSSSENIVYDIEKPMKKSENPDSVDNTTNIEEFSELLSKPENNESSNTGLVPATENTPLEPLSNGSVLPVNQQPQEKLKLQPGEKKFVVYIEPENIDFIESFYSNLFHEYTRINTAQAYYLAYLEIKEFYNGFMRYRFNGVPAYV